MHFFDFINSYRVLFAKDLLSDQDHTARYTLDSTAAMSGFNNRSSFFTAFKKLTNTTPSAYKKLQPETV